MADVSFGGPQLPRRSGHRQDFRVSRPSPASHGRTVAVMHICHCESRQPAGADHGGRAGTGAAPSRRDRRIVPNRCLDTVPSLSANRDIVTATRTGWPVSAADGNRHGDLGNRGCVRRHSPGIETARPSDSSERCVGCGAGPPACPSGFEQRQALGRGPRAHTHQLLKRALANPLSRTAASLPPRQMPHRCGPLHAVGRPQR